jgi:hypothetical protein
LFHLTTCPFAHLPVLAGFPWIFGPWFGPNKGYFALDKGFFVRDKGLFASNKGNSMTELILMLLKLKRTIKD